MHSKELVKMHLTKNCKRLVCGFILLLIIHLHFSISKSDNLIQTPPESQPQLCSQFLLLNVLEDDTAKTTTLYKSGLKQISCSYLSEVRITINDTDMLLADAIAEEFVSFEKIAAWSKLDAESGFCSVKYTSNNGLTQSIYRYDSYELMIYDDIYETPDGSNHHIQSCSILPPGRSSRISVFHIDPSGKILDREDWGIAIKPIQVSASEVKFQIDQAGGQQIGCLVTKTFFLDSKIDGKNILRNKIKIDLNMGGSTEVNWNWQHSIGKLPSGTYRITFQLLDKYDETQVHPLMQNYHDSQYYGFSFTVP